MGNVKTQNLLTFEGDKSRNLLVIDVGIAAASMSHSVQLDIGLNDSESNISEISMNSKGKLG